jgi:hypothetical protein
LEFEVMTYVIVHRMFSLSVSLPVRGADGLAKRALYGGVERQRLSSQSVKAHLRVSTGVPGSMADLAASLDTEMSVRSALIGPNLIAPALVEKHGLTHDAASNWADAVMALFQSGKKAPAREAVATKKSKKAKAEAESEDGELNEDGSEDATTTSDAGRQILTLGKQEIAALIAVAVALHKEKVAPSEMRSFGESNQTEEPREERTSCARGPRYDAKTRWP